MASIHIVGGISRRGAKILMIFSGYQNAAGFQDLVYDFIISFVNEVYHNYHRLHYDNASFHGCPSSESWLREIILITLKHRLKVQI